MRRTVLVLAELVAVAAVISIGAYWLLQRRAESHRFNEAITRVPLPPGFTQLTFDGEDPPRDFYISAVYPASSAGELLPFCEQWFAEHGWKSTFPPNEAPDGMLDFNKEKAHINVSTIAIQRTVRFLVIYTEYEYTREEFDVLVSETGSPEAKALLETVAQRYVELTSYRDTGTYERMSDGEIDSRATFSTALPIAYSGTPSLTASIALSSARRV